MTTAEQIEENADLDTEVEQEEGEVEAEQEETETEETEQEEGEELVVTIGDEEPDEEAQQEARAPDWVRELRREHRELKRENKELKSKLETPTTEQLKVGEKPKLEDFDYDSDKYEQALAAWFERKRKADEQAEAAEAQAKAQAEAWQSRLNHYGEKKEELSAPDFDDAEGAVLENLSEVQQGIIVQGADNPAHVVYALGKNPKRLKDLAGITDPIQFAFAVAKLEKDIKMRNRKAPPPPERVPTGGTGIPGSSDAKLEKLRKEAEGTGDYTKVNEYRRKLRQSKR